VVVVLGLLIVAVGDGNQQVVGQSLVKPTKWSIAIQKAVEDAKEEPTLVKIPIINDTIS
jgi:ribosomal protein S5